MKHPHCMTDGAPRRVWESTDNGWTSREWLMGEMDTYAQEILGWESAHCREKKTGGIEEG
jgi:hypothetical protein